MSIFEAIMLICFGAAWPVSIFKSLTTRSIEGKSFWFMIIVLAGYGAGITHKLIYDLDNVFFLYILNFLLVLIDILLYWKNKRYLENENI